MKILIVDDSLTVRMQIKKNIQALVPGAEFILAESGEQALENTDGSDLDFAVLDYNMEGMTGIELAVILNKNLSINDMVLCSANEQIAIQNKAAELGLQYIEKPFNASLIESLSA